MNANLLRRSAIRGCFAEIFLRRGCSRERLAGVIIDDLRVDVLA